MIFKSITLHNIFSYYGPKIFDLAPVANNPGNIVVIMGRNGFGKTSLLNSIKLLFGGVTKELRESVQRDKMPLEKGFVRGDNDWWGILNQKAKSEGNLECSVAAILLDENNREISIERRWNLSNDNYKNQLTVKAPYYPPLSDDNAQQYLSSILPLDFIPFFFFDAEEIGHLAEANRIEQKEKMELLLNIRSIDNLKTCLKEVLRKVENEYISKNIKQRLHDEESKQKSLHIEQEELLEQKNIIQVNIESLNDDIREIRSKISMLNGQATVENSAKLEASKNTELNQLEQALTDLSEVFERDAFLRLNGNGQIIERAILVIQQCADNQRGTTAEMLSSLREPLKQVFTTPPYPEQRLIEAQVVFYQKRISKLLDSRDIEEADSKPFELNPSRAKKILALLSGYTAQHKPATGLQASLARALRADNIISEIDKSLLDVRQLSEGNKQQLIYLQTTLSDQEEALLKLKDEGRAIDHKLGLNQRELSPLDGKIAELRKQARQNEHGLARIELVGRMQKLLDTYKHQLKKQQRGVLESYFNHHLNCLLDSNRLISKTKIDDEFQLHYLDAADGPVAMGSISAGMKQLAATALLWALKDACGRQLPVIIDTPLGRIDKQHQENLLSRYYPHAAKQVILLPTDSELDERKRRLLEPYIYREFHLHNPDGENTEINEITQNKEVHYG